MSSTDDRDFRINIKFLGANNGVVTGSATLLRIKMGDVIRNILVDYGVFQGIDESFNEYRVIDSSEVDCVLLTHSHLDHCGGLPILFNEVDGVVQFDGKIYASRETCRQAVHILRDSAKINEVKAYPERNVLKKTHRQLEKDKHEAVRKSYKPKEIAQLDSDFSRITEQEDNILYGVEEVEEAISHFVPIDFSHDDRHVDVELYTGIVARFIPTPHINGSCMIEVTASYAGETYAISFTGDVGKDDTLLYKKMKYSLNSDVKSIVMESLHGASNSPERLSMSIEDFRKLITRNLRKDHTIIISTFSIRIPEMVMLMNLFMDQGLHFDCVIDSPLGMKELGEYASSYNTRDSAWFKYSFNNPFSLERIKVIDNYKDHQYMVDSYGPKVILTSSGMGYGGRVLDYFEHHVQNEKSTFIFPGYMTEDSPSRILHETSHGRMCELNGRRYVKHCKTYWPQGFSSHGYYEDKCEILDCYLNLDTIFLNHGDDDTLRELYVKLSDRYSSQANIIVPSYEDSFELF